jgi:hypothetical protein
MKKTKKPHKAANKSIKPKKPQFIPLPLIQDEMENLDKEMEELFDEDKVTHQQGTSEPERD